MRVLALFFVFLILLLTVSTATARQDTETQDEQNALAHLQQITLASAGGDSVNIGEVIGENPFTLVVMYRGVW